MPGIRDLLGELPSGAVAPLKWSEVGEYLRKNYIGNDADHVRKGQQALAKRRDYYEDKTLPHIVAVIDRVFASAELKQEMRKYASLAAYQNVTRRVTEELSTVYSESASRSVANAGEQARYQQLLRLPSVRINSRMRQGNEYCNLLNQCLLWFYVRNDGTPDLRVWTPDIYVAVGHPLDPTRWIATIFPVHRHGFGKDPLLPRWQVWTDHETFSLDGLGYVMSQTIVEHGYGRQPGVLVHRRQPLDTLTDYTSGADIISAHDAVSLLNVLLVRGEKSGSRVAYLAGDVSRTATGQTFDPERPLVLQDGVAPGTLDLRADPTSLINSARFIIKQIAANHGIPESVFDLSYQATSGFEIELKRTGLREKRHQQIMDPWRTAEAELAAVMAAVLGQGTPYSYSLDGWTIDFGEYDTPQDPGRRLDVWQKRLEMGLMSREEMVLKENPEFTADQASQQLDDNIAAEAEYLEKRRLVEVTTEPTAELGPAELVTQPRNGPVPEA